MWIFWVSGWNRRRTTRWCSQPNCLSASLMKFNSLMLFFLFQYFRFETSSFYTAIRFSIRILFRRQRISSLSIWACVAREWFFQRSVNDRRYSLSMCLNDCIATFPHQWAIISTWNLPHQRLARILWIVSRNWRCLCLAHHWVLKFIHWAHSGRWEFVRIRHFLRRIASCPVPLSWFRWRL